MRIRYVNSSCSSDLSTALERCGATVYFQMPEVIRNRNSNPFNANYMYLGQECDLTFSDKDPKVQPNTPMWYGCGLDPNNTVFDSRLSEIDLANSLGLFPKQSPLLVDFTSSKGDLNFPCVIKANLQENIPFNLTRKLESVDDLAKVKHGYDYVVQELFTGDEATYGLLKAKNGFLDHMLYISEYKDISTGISRANNLDRIDIVATKINPKWILELKEKLLPHLENYIGYVSVTVKGNDRNFLEFTLRPGLPTEQLLTKLLDMPYLNYIIEMNKDEPNIKFRGAVITSVMLNNPGISNVPVFISKTTRMIPLNGSVIHKGEFERWLLHVGTSCCIFGMGKNLFEAIDSLNEELANLPNIPDIVYNLHQLESGETDL